MSSPPAIPPAEYEIFANPPLKAMLGQVRFPPVLKIADFGTLGAFQEEVREEWPNFAQEQQLNFVLGPGVPPSAGAVQQVFRFTTGDGLWSMVLAPDVLTLEVAPGGSYSSYAQFSKRFRQAWSAVLTHFSPNAVSRQGLRYVDHIEGKLEPAEWQRLINPELLAPVSGTLSEGLVQAIAEYRFRRDDGVLVFKHGIAPAGPDNTEGYLLDFDLFTETPGEARIENLMERFDRYHETLYAFFRWCVTEEALEGFRRAA